MKFNELPQRAKENTMRDVHEHLDYYWWDCTYEDSKEQGKERGFEIEDIFFSGFRSQGDGASWKGHVNIPHYLANWLAAPDAPKCPDYVLHLALLSALTESDAGNTTHWPIKTRGNYQHSMTMHMDDRDELLLWEPKGERTDSFLSGPFQGADVWDTIEALGYNEQEFEEEEVLEAARDYANGIYKKLEAEYDYLTGEECFAESHDDVDYDEDGNEVDDVSTTAEAGCLIEGA